MSIDDLMRDNNREMAAGARAGARAAARRLADVYDPRLPAQVEAALHPSIRNRHRPEQYLDLVSLGSLIVSVASTAWMVYQDLRSRQPAPVAQDVVVHRVRIRLDHADPAGQPQLTPAQQTQLLEIVVEEVLRVADTSTDGGPQPDPDLPPQTPATE
ncbi:hypothetical protein [Streptomyces sp. NBC_01538]|uniref:hypothetical protein n=1 Tax=Streptomyces sp. NBC_01538 TaxID=2903897 RepID=UPI003865C73F